MGDTDVSVPKPITNQRGKNMKSEARGNINLDTYSDLITMAAGAQDTNTIVKKLLNMIGEPECIINRSELATQIHNLKLYTNGILCTKYGAKPIFHLSNEDLKIVHDLIESRIKHGAWFKQFKGHIEGPKMQELLMGSPYMSKDEARTALIRAINDRRVIVEKEDGTRPAFNIGALHLCADGELFHIDDIVTMYNFTDQDMKNIIVAIEQRIVRDAELVAMEKRMKETKEQSTQPATAPMTMFQKAQNWLTGIKQQFRAK